MIHDISAKNFKKYFKWKKIQLKVSKSGVFEKKKSQSQLVAGTFFETTSEAKCPEKPLANPEKSLANAEKPLADSAKPLPNECGRRVYLTTTPLPYQPRVKPVLMSDLPPKKVSLIFMKIYRNEV